MNERIKLLAEQATSIVESPPNREGYTSSYANFDREKFAELIVEECVAQCWTVSAIEHKGTVISECSKRMRKHFGVEE